MIGKNVLHIRIQQKKNYQNDELFLLGFENVLKMQVSVINKLMKNSKQILKTFWDEGCSSEKKKFFGISKKKYPVFSTLLNLVADKFCVLLLRV